MKTTVNAVCLEDFEKKAYEILEQNALDYYRSGAAEQFTLKLNQDAFKKYPKYFKI